jgi:hypothetical protein
VHFLSACCFDCTDSPVQVASLPACHVEEDVSMRCRPAASRLDPHTLDKTTDSHINHVMASSHAMTRYAYATVAAKQDSYNTYVQSKPSPSTSALILHATSQSGISAFNQSSSHQQQHDSQWRRQASTIHSSPSRHTMSSPWYRTPMRAASSLRRATK